MFRPAPPCLLMLGLLAGCSVVAGCSDDGTARATGAGGGGAGSGGSGAGGIPTECGPPPGGERPGAVCVLEVRGSIIDEADAPIADLLVTACGDEGCEPADTIADGSFRIAVGFPIVVGGYAVQAHSREINKAAFYFSIGDEPGPTIDVGALRLLELPGDGQTLVVKTDNMAPPQTVTSGDVTLEVPAGVRVKRAFDDVALGDEGKKFRALKVPANFQDEYADPALGIVALYALTPFDATFDEEANPGTAADVRLSFVNTTGLAADTPVELLALGSYSITTTVTGGEFGPVATGVVSSDGTMIVMDPGEGVDFLTWMGVRQIP